MKHKIQPIIEKIGSGKPIVGIVGAMHGNESGPQIIEKLKKTIKPKKGTLVFLTANTKAREKNVRFVDEDLNRAFPGKKNGNYEQQLAHELTKIGKKFDYLIDLHSCSMESAPFCIIRSFAGEDMQLAKCSKLPFVVVYPRTTQGGGSFIDYVKCGIGLELGLHDKKSTVQDGYKAVLNILKSLEVIEGRVKKNQQKILKVIGHLERKEGITMREDIKNFQKIKKDQIIGTKNGKPLYAQNDFYPVLYKEKSYTNTYGWIGEEVRV